jgi:hypothetical protein
LAICLAKLPYNEVEARFDQKLLRTVILRPIGVINKRWCKVPIQP